MNKKRGFTLVEVLAILVILAIIGTIAAPNILHIVDSSKEKAVKSTAQLLAKAAEDYYSERVLTSDELDKVNLSDDTLVYRGDRPDVGYAFFDDVGRSYIKMYYDGYCVVRNYDGKVELEETSAANCSIADMVTITIYANGGIIIADDSWIVGEGYASVIINFNEALENVPTVTRTGYTFKGWYTEEGEPVNLNHSFTENVAAIAKWEVNKYLVTLDLAGGTVEGTFTKTREVEFGKPYGNLPTPTRKGYNFRGWYTAGGTEIRTETVLSNPSNHTLYASWDAINYDLTLDAVGGKIASVEGWTLINDEKVTKEYLYGTTYEGLLTPSKTGYTFKGWYTLDDKKVDNTVTVENDLVLYAKWEANKYIITFNSNGGNVIESIEVIYDTNYGELPTPIKTGNEFLGWKTKNGTLVLGTDAVKITQNTTLYADWKMVLYTVVFNADGGIIPSSSDYTLINSSTASKNVTFEKEYGILPEPTKSGYEFKGWFDSNNVKFESSTIVNLTDNQNLYAKWEANTYTVKFNSNGGSAVSNIDVVFGEPYGTLPDPTKTGYTFTGWMTTGGVIVTSETNVNIANDHTLNAQWGENEYTVIFNANGGNVSTPSKLVVYGEEYGNLPTPTREGYQFKGWYNDNDIEIKNTTIVNVSTNHILVAKWGANTYTVKFDSNGGSQVPDKEVLYGEPYGLLPIPERPGYKFEGWASTGGKIETSTIVQITSEQTLEAQWSAYKYTIVFNSNGGNSVANKTVTYGSEYGEFDEPSRAGYTFAGWFTAQTGGTKVIATDTVEITSDAIFHAHWTVNKYTLTFVYGNGEANTTKEIIYDSIYGELPTPTRVGYKFEGWATKSGNLITKDSTVKVEANQELYAQWSANTIVIIFVYNNGESSTTREVLYNDEYGELPSPSKVGYTFKGWYTSDTGGTKVNSTDKVTSNNIQNLYARWEANKYTVTFVYNNGDINTTKEVTYDSTYGTLPTPTRKGYTFHAWSTGSGNIVSKDTKVTLAENHVLTAQWGTNTYLVIFDANGGKVSIPTITVNFDNPYGTLPTPTREGYEFKGWYYNDTKVESDTSILSATTHTLKAKWEAKTYTITFKYNNDVTADTTKEVTYDSTYGTLPTPTKKGYIFKGWANNGGNTITSDTKVTLAENHEISAQWIPNEHIVTFVYNNGDADTTKKVMTEFTYGELPAPTKLGYDFVGWYTDSLNGTKIESSTVVELTNDQTLYGRWEAKTYIITFVYNDEITANTTKEVLYDSIYNTLPTPIREGYTFIGWYNSGGTKIESSTRVQIISDTTLYAQWEANTYTVMFKYNDGTTKDTTKVVTYDSTYGELPAPTKIGYTFKGWYTNTTAQTKIESSTTVKITETQTLQGIWEVNKYTIRFETNGGTPAETIEVVYGEPYGELPIPTKTGYVFNEWSTSGGVVITSNSIVQVTANTTLYAQWGVNSYLVTFDANGGDVSIPYTSIKYSEVYGTLPEPTREGYTFKGWYTEKNAGTVIVSTTVMNTANNHTLYAQWEGNKYTVTFNPIGGTVSPTTMEVTYGEAYGELPTPVKEASIFHHWVTTGGMEINKDSIYSIIGDITLYAIWEDIYYLVLDENGNMVTYATDLKSAVTQSLDGYAIELLKDAKETSYTTISGAKNITIDTNGYILDLGSSYIDIRGSGGNVDPTILNIEGNGIIYSTNKVLHLDCYAIVNVYDVTMYSTGNTTIGSNSGASGSPLTINIYSGTIYSKTSYAISSSGYNNVAKNKLAVYGGTVYSESSAALYAGYGSVIIGNNSENIESNPIIRGETYAIQSSVKVEYYNGILYSKSGAINNTSNLGVTSYANLNEGQETINGEIYNKSYLTKKDELQNSYNVYDLSNNKVGTTGSLESAIGMSENGYTIELIQNGNESIQRVIDKNIKLNLNGYTLNMNETYLKVNPGVTFTIEGKGSIYSSTYPIYNQGSTIINGGNIYSIESYGIYNIGSTDSPSTVTIGTNDKIIDNSLPIVRGKTYGIYNDNSSSITKFYDGTIYYTTDPIYGNAYFESNTIWNVGNTTIDSVSYGYANREISSTYNYEILNKYNGHIAYATDFVDALTKAKDEYIIKMINNANEKYFDILMFKNVTFNTNGYTLDLGNKKIIVPQNIILNINGLGIIKSTNYPVEIKKGTVNLSDTTIYSTNSYGMYVSGILSMNSGTIYSTTSDGLYVYSYNDVIINGGTIYSTAEGKRAIYAEYSNLSIAGGNIYSLNGTAIYFIANSSYKLTIGKNDSTISTTNPIIKGKTNGIYNAGYLYYYDGIIYYDENQTGEYSSIKESSSSAVYLPTNISLTTTTVDIDDKIYFADCLTLLTGNNYEVFNTNGIHVTYASSLSEAIERSSAEYTIKLLKDVNESTTTISKNINLNLNGNSIDMGITSIIINSNSSLNIEGIGTIKSKGVTISNSGTVVISDATIYSTGSYAIEDNYRSNIQINSGTIYSSVNYAIKDNYGGNIKINGGTIYSDGTYAIDTFHTNLEINGGVIYSTASDGINLDSSSAIITGGIIYSTERSGINVNNSSSTLSLGVNDENILSSSPIVRGKTNAIYNYNGTINIYDGILYYDAEQTGKYSAIRSNTTINYAGTTDVMGTTEIDGVTYSYFYRQ